MNHTINIHLRAILLMVQMLLLPSMTWAESEAWVEYADGTLTFHYDENKYATEAQTYSLNTSDAYPAWLTHGAEIKTVVFDESFAQVRPTSCYRWFYKFINLTSIEGIENLNTSEVTTMREMFYECSSLTSLNLRGFDTRKVTTMNSMFTDDVALTYITLSDQFTGTSLKDANWLFASCKALKNLDLSSFETTDSLTSTQCMFTLCSSLTRLDLSGMVTSHVTDMSYMFSGCSGITGILVSHTFTVDSVTTDTNMFYDCTSLKHFVKTSIGKEKAFYYNDGYLTYMAYAEYNAESKTLTFYGKNRFFAEMTTDEIYDFNIGDTAPDWLTHSADIETVVFDESIARARPTTCYQWFYQVTQPTTITGLEYLNTSEVTSLRDMFNGCTSMTSLNLSGFNPEKVTTMRRMFYNDTALKEVTLSDQFTCTNLVDVQGLFRQCTSLTNLDFSQFKTTDKLTWAFDMFRDCSSLVSVDLTGMNTSGVKSINQIFQGCRALRNIYTSDAFVLGVGCTGGYMFTNCISLPGYDANEQDKDKAKYFPEGYFYNVNPAPWVSYNAMLSTLTFHYDNLWDKNLVDKIYVLNTNENTPQWASHKDEVTRVVIEDPFVQARPTSCYQWFKGSAKLLSIDGIQNLNTSEVITMQEMFRDCPLLTALDLSGFNTSKVTRMQSMFRDCPLLTALDLSSFNTSKVTRMESMFRDCSKLQTLNISNFDIQNVTDMSYMLYNDSTLTDLTIPSKLTGTSLENATALFKNCKSLTALDLRGFTTTAALKTIDQMFEGCSSIKYIRIPAMNTSGVTNMSYMFQNDSVLKLIWTSDYFVVADTTQGDDMFKGCIALTGYEASKVGKEMAIYFPEGFFYNNASVAWVGYDTQSKTLTFHYSSTWDNATEDKIYGFNTGTNLPGWYPYRGEVEKVVIEKAFTTARPTSCYYWFDDFSKLQSIEGLTYMNTSEVTNMESMFRYCPLTSLDLSSFNTSKVTTMREMFRRAVALKEIKFSDQFTGTSLEDATSIFMDCQSLKSVTLSGFKTTEALKDISQMFRGCKAIEYISLPLLNTSGVTDMRYMFLNCHALSVIMVSDAFTVDKVEQSTNMFLGCLSLPGFDENSVGIEKACFYPQGYFYNSARSMWTAYDHSAHTLTFHYDTQKDACKATYTYDVPLTTKTPGWSSAINADTITVEHVIFSSDFALARPKVCYGWFSGMKDLTDIEGVEHLNTSEVTTMESMFRGCTKLKELDVTGFNTANVVNTAQMFSYCSALTGLDFSTWDLSSDLIAKQMFYNCYALEHIYVTEAFALNNNCSGEQMFVNCYKLPHFSTYDNDKAMAHYKEGGYLTLRRYFTVGDTRHTAYRWGDETMCYDDVTFTDDKPYASTFAFTLDTDKTASYTRAVSNHWATLCLPFAFSAEDNPSASYYGVKRYTEGTITATPLTGEIAAGTPVLAYVTDGELSVSATGAAAVATPATDDVLQGVFTQTEVADKDYIIANDRFWNALYLKKNNNAAKNVYVAPYRASLTLDLSEGAKPNSISIADPTGVSDSLRRIEDTDPSALLDGAELYDLQGRRLAAPTRGVMIVRKGGVSHKVVIK